ncbi:MAG: extracellular solute-binding protein, partial [Enterococcus sp.]
AFPGTDSTKPMTAGAADLSVAISEKSKHQKAAQKFVEYLTTKEAMQPYFDVDGSPTFVKSVDTKGKFPELEGISSLVGTDQQIIWLHKDWTSEEDFWYANLDYIIDGDSAKYEKSLNAFFDTMKD